MKSIERGQPENLHSPAQSPGIPSFNVLLLPLLLSVHEYHNTRAVLTNTTVTMNVGSTRTSCEVS